MRSFLELGLDWSTEALSADEKAQLLAWYGDAHVQEGVRLSRMPEFLIEHDPNGFKRYRQFILEIDREQNGRALPQAAHLLLFLYSYTVLGFEDGILYTAISARQLGASRGEVVDTMRLAAVAAGPLGLDAAGGKLDAYLREWPSDDGAGLPWPPSWQPDPDAFRSGIEIGTSELLPGELELVLDWYRRAYGEAPPHAETFARLHPTAWKTSRGRFETALGDALPVQMAPLCMLHVAAMRLWKQPMRRAAQLARHVGVEREYLVGTVLWAAMYGGDVVLETAFAAIGDLLEAA